MANDVLNDMVVFSTDKSELERLLKDGETMLNGETMFNGKLRQFCFHALLPMPKEYDNNNGLTPIIWQQENWGAKWGPYHVELGTIQEDISNAQDGYSLRITYTTAWSNCTEGLRRLVEKYNVSFSGKYFDINGQCYAGTYHISQDETSESVLSNKKAREFALKENLCEKENIYDY